MRELRGDEPGAGREQPVVRGLIETQLAGGFVDGTAGGVPQRRDALARMVDGAGFVEEADGAFHVVVRAFGRFEHADELVAIPFGCGAERVREQHGAFAFADVAAHRLAGGCARPNHIEQVIGELEGQAKADADGFGDRSRLGGIDAGRDEAEFKWRDGGVAGGFPAEDVERGPRQHLGLVQRHLLGR